MNEPAAIAWRRRFSRLATLTTILAVIVAFSVSSMALSALGVGYTAPGGNPLAKLHPSNWLFAFALLFNLLSAASPRAYLAELPRAFPGATFFSAMWVCLIAYAILVQHAPATPLIDTFFAAVAFLPLHRALEGGARIRLRRLLHGIMFVNASLGILEFLLHFRLTPFAVAGTAIVDDYRSTALLGHPLLNAGTTGAYILMLFFHGDPEDRPLLRAGMMALQMVAMVAFGGRTAIVLGVSALALGSLPTIAAILGGRRFDERLGIVIAIGSPIVVAAAFFAVSQGLFTDLVARFVDDKGSSEARVVIFDLFGQFSLADLLLGPDQERLQSLQTILGIEYGIENSWLGFVFQYGLLISVMFIGGFLALIAEYMARSRRGSWILVGYFLILASSSASLSVKSLVLSQFAILMITIFGREFNHEVIDAASIVVDSPRPNYILSR